MGGVILSYGRVEDLATDLKAWRGSEGNTVFLTPSSEDRELLRGLLAGEGAFFGEFPAVWRWSDLYRELGKAAKVSLKGQLDPPDHALVVAHVVKEFLDEADRRGAALPPGVRRGGFVDLLGRHLRELLREGVQEEALAQALGCPGCSGPRCDHLERPGGILCRFFRNYNAWLEGHDLADSAAVPSLAAELLDREEARRWARGRRFLLVGFLSFTSAQLRLVRALAGAAAECVLVKPDPGIGGFYDGADQLEGWRRERRSLPGGIWQPLVAGNPTLEPEVAVRELALWASGRGSLAPRFPWPGFGGVGMVVPREDLPLLEEALGRFRVPWCFRGKVSAAETFLASLPRQIWHAARGGWGFRETALVLGHPLVGGDGALEDALRERPSGEAAWRAWDKRRGEDLFDRGATFARVLDEGASPRRLLEALETLINEGTGGLRRAGALAEAPLFGPEGPREGELDGAVRRLAGALFELRRKIRALEEREKSLQEAGNVLFQGMDALQFMEEWAEEATVTASPPLEGAVTLYAGTPPVLASHAVLFFLGLTASRWPGAGADSPLLGEELRTAVNGGETPGSPPLHLLLRHERRSQKEALFRRVVAVGRDLTVLSYPQMDSEGRPAAPSPFLEALGQSAEYVVLGAPLTRSAADLLPGEEEPYFPAREAPRRGRLAFRGDFPRTAVWSPRDGGNLSDLDLFVSCPFAYCCARLRGLEEERIEEEGVVDPLREGNFLHRLWELVWKTPGAGEEEVPLASLVDRCWDEALEPEAASLSPHPYEGYPALRDDPRCRSRSRFLRFAAHRLARLQDEAEACRRSDGVAKIHRLLESVKPRVTVEGVTFFGRCDRVDVTSEGALLLDYKLGKVKKGKNEKRLQLAAYALALERDGESLEVPVGGMAYLGHGDGAVQGVMEAPFRRWYGVKGQEKLVEALGEAEEALERMARALKTGSYPANYESPRCSWCPYAALCRRGENRGEAQGSGEDSADEDGAPEEV